MKVPSSESSDEPAYLHSIATVFTACIGKNIDVDEGSGPKIVSMIRKYHNHKPQTTPGQHEEKPLNHHETPERQSK